MNPNILRSHVSREEHGLHFRTSQEVGANLGHTEVSNKLRVG